MYNQMQKINTWDHVPYLDFQQRAQKCDSF